MPRRSRTAANLATWLGTSATPLFVLDAQRRIRLFNAGCQALTGWSATDVVGEVCHYSAAAEASGPRALAASICPPPDAFAGQQVVMPGCVVRRSSGTVNCLFCFVPLLDEAGMVTGVLGAAFPAAELPATVELPPERRLHAELAAIHAALRARYDVAQVVASSPAMRRVMVQVDLAARSTVCALLAGEAGCGREHLARAIHLASTARSRAFVPVDCRRATSAELERLLGRLMAAGSHGGSSDPLLPGTIYLAEVQHLPRDLQQVLCERWLSRPEQARPPARLLACAPARLELTAGGLTDEFAALVSPLVIEIPPLRERTAEIPLLAQQFLEQSNASETRQLAGFDERVWPLLVRYHWPGNLDELAAVVEEARARCHGRLIGPDDLPYRLRAGLEAQAGPASPAPRFALDRVLEQVERRLISMALARAGQNKARAAQWLEISRARLLRRIEQLKLENSGGSGESGDPGAGPAEPPTEPGNSIQES